jgi:hypothetical protein
LETAARIVYLAHEIWLYRILAVGNKISQPEEEGLIREGLPDDIPLLSVLPYLRRTPGDWAPLPYRQSPEFRSSCCYGARP